MSTRQAKHGSIPNFIYFKKLKFKVQVMFIKGQNVPVGLGYGWKGHAELLPLQELEKGRGFYWSPCKTMEKHLYMLRISFNDWYYTELLLFIYENNYPNQYSCRSLIFPNCLNIYFTNSNLNPFIPTPLLTLDLNEQIWF